MTGVFDTGQAVDLAQRTKPLPSAPERDHVFYEWPEWCRKEGFAYKLDDGRISFPRLVDWERDDVAETETFHIELPGGWSSATVREKLPAQLRAGMHAHAAAVRSVDATGIRVTLSHYQLPELLPFDPARVPASPDRVYIGQLAEGSDLILDFTSTSHAMVVGQNGSGKSETDKMILAQLWAKGWHVVIVTPTEADSTFEDFEDRERCEVFCGSSDEAIRAVADRLLLADEESVAREKERGEASRWSRARGGPSVRVYGEDCGWDWKYPKEIWFIDETADVLVPDKNVDSPEAFQSKSEILNRWVRRHRRGRKGRQHCLSSSQQPNVDNIGGGQVLNEIGFTLAIRSLRQTFVKAVFPQTEQPDVDRVLVQPGTKPGRGIARGAADPDNDFAGALDDTPVQVAWITEEQLLEVLSGDLTSGPSPAAVEEPDSEATRGPATRLVADGTPGDTTATGSPGARHRTVARLYATAAAASAAVFCACAYIMVTS